MPCAHQGQQEQKSPPIWKLPTFAALLADPYIEGTELEGGHVAVSLQVVCPRYFENDFLKDRVRVSCGLFCDAICLLGSTIFDQTPEGFKQTF